MAKRKKRVKKMDAKRLDDNARSRVVALLTREEMDFIDKLSKDALFSTGHKLSRTEIISALIDAVSTKDISAEGVRSKSELEEKLRSKDGSR